MTLRDFIFIAVISCLVTYGFYVGMSKELCLRDLSDQEYTEMRLDCNQ